MNANQDEQSGLDGVVPWGLWAVATVLVFVLGIASAEWIAEAIWSVDKEDAAQVVLADSDFSLMALMVPAALFGLAYRLAVKAKSAFLSQLAFMNPWD